MDIALKRMADDLSQHQDKLVKLQRRKEELEHEISMVQREVGDIKKALEIFQRYQDPGTNDAERVKMLGQVPMGVIPEVRVTKREAMLEALRERPGSRVRDLIRVAEGKCRSEIAPKSAGNILWQFKQEGLAFRDGHNWHPVKEDAPPAEASGA